MLITEAQMGMSAQPTDALAILDKMNYLSESVYAPAMVPIVENSELKANVIRLEDMTQFCEANGVVDFGAALKAVCEASEVDPSTICFSVQEANIVADKDMAELVAGIMNEGVQVVAAPISESDDMVILANAAIQQMIETGSDKLLEAYASMDFDTMEQILSEAEQKAEEPKKEPNKSQQAMKDNMQGPSAVQKFIAKVKHYTIETPKKYISNAIVALRKWTFKVQEEAAKAEGDKKSLWLSIKEKIANAIQYLLKLVDNAKAYDTKGKNGKELTAQQLATRRNMAAFA